MTPNFKKSIWKDKWFFYKLLTTIYIFTVLLWIFFGHTLRSKWIGIENEHIPYSIGKFSAQYLSYLSIQINIVTGLWFLLATINHKKTRNWIFNQSTVIVVTSYITVISWIYMIFLFPFKVHEYTFVVILEALSMHLIIPLLMIIYLIFKIERKPISSKVYFKNYFFKSLIYPLIYLFFIIFRFLVLRLQGLEGDFTFPYIIPSKFLSNSPFLQTVLPPFLFCLGIVAWLVMFFGANKLFIMATNKLTNKHIKTQNSQKFSS